MPKTGVELIDIPSETTLRCSGRKAGSFILTEEGDVYLFSYFTGNGQDGLHLAYSCNGLNWKPLNNGASLLTPMVGKDRLMRDPSITRGKDGLFHMVWTTGWWDRHIVYASSPDLIHWSEHHHPVMCHEPETQKQLGTRAFYDEADDILLLCLGLTVSGIPEISTSEREKGLNHLSMRSPRELCELSIRTFLRPRL